MTVTYIPALSVTCLYRSYYTRGLWEIHYAETHDGSFGGKRNKKACRYLMCIGRPTFLTFFLMPFFHMCCAFISKSTLPYFWQGAFSFCSLSLVCQFLLAGSGCSLTLSVIVNDRHERLLPSNIGLFSNDMESTSVTT